MGLEGPEPAVSHPFQSAKKKVNDSVHLEHKRRWCTEQGSHEPSYLDRTTENENVSSQERGPGERNDGDADQAQTLRRHSVFMDTPWRPCTKGGVSLHLICIVTP